MEEVKLTDEELAIKMKREYHKEWRKNHKEQIRKYNQEYWLKKSRQAQAEGK